ncbi:hypothetical protein DERF_014778 [Dermatophagoides farinae]|uniref:Uncharacterized protein n=1 Tax=Dermatophagoides farinae TaxID=6954 RepID=A0A922HJH9_DERFA|nr:hypothetical protein DERF_014778 [Dermatophagoides farinae]
MASASNALTCAAGRPSLVRTWPLCDSGGGCCHWIVMAVDERGAPTTPTGLEFGGCAGNVIGGLVEALG